MRREGEVETSERKENCGEGVVAVDEVGGEEVLVGGSGLGQVVPGEVHPEEVRLD